MMNSLKNWFRRLRQKLSWMLAAKVLAGLFVTYLLLSYFAVDPLARNLFPILQKNL